MNEHVLSGFILQLLLDFRSIRNLKKVKMIYDPVIWHPPRFDDT